MRSFIVTTASGESYVLDPQFMKYAFEAMVKDFEREPVIQRYARQRNIHRDPSDPLACKAVVTWKKIDGVQIAICPVHEEVVNVYVTYEE